jgi:hypothetical protein
MQYPVVYVCSRSQGWLLAARARSCLPASLISVVVWWPQATKEKQQGDKAGCRSGFGRPLDARLRVNKAAVASLL